MHVAGTALAGIPGNHDGYGELMPDVATIEWDSGKALLELIERVGAERIAAFFCEPIIGAGGIYLPPEGYLAEVRQICREHDILFVADEVITGFGRIGGVVRLDPIRPAAGHDDHGEGPDLRVRADGRGLRRAAGRRALLRPGRRRLVAARLHLHGARRRGRRVDGQPGHHRAGGLADEAARLEATLHEKFAPLAEHPAVPRCAADWVRSPPCSSWMPGAALGLAKGLRAHGVAARAVGAGAIQVSPAFVMTDEQVDDLVAGFRGVLAAVLIRAVRERPGCAVGVRCGAAAARTGPGCRTGRRPGGGASPAGTAPGRGAPGARADRVTAISSSTSAGVDLAGGSEEHHR